VAYNPGQKLSAELLPVGRGGRNFGCEPVKLHRKASSRMMAEPIHSGRRLLGLGVPKIKWRAVKWYRKAAERIL